MALTTIAGNVNIPTGAAPNSARLLFTLVTWDMDGSTVYAPDPIEEPLSGSVYSVALESTTDKQKQAGYKVELLWYSPAKRTTLVEVLGVIEVPPSGGPYDFPDLIAIVPPLVPDQAYSYQTRVELVSAIGAGMTPIHGLIYEAAGLQYQGFSGATVIADLPGLLPTLPYRAAHHGETDGTVTITLKPTGGQFSTPQAAFNYACGFSQLDTVTIEQDGTVQGSLSLLSDAGHVIWKAKTARATLAYADFTAAYAPNWALGTNNTSDPATNTLFLATKAAIGAMLRAKYSAIVEVASGNGIELRGNKLQLFEDILLTNTSNGQRGISTGESLDSGAGGNLKMLSSSIHGFMASGLAMNYGGSVIAYDLSDATSICTFSCNGDSGIISQYAPSSVYTQDGIVYANFQFGIRFKQFGMVYPGRGYVCYNRIDGVSMFLGGELNGLEGHFDYNGGYGINILGSASCAEATDGTASNNIGGGVQAKLGATAYCERMVANNNGGIAFYAPGGSISATSAVANGSGSHAANATVNGYIGAIGATLSNSANGMGARVDGSGEIDCANAIIYGNTNAFTKQVFINGGAGAGPGRINITGAVDNLAVAITDAACTPAPNVPTDQLSLIKRSSTNSTNMLLSNVLAAMANASGPALSNVAASATVPTVLPNKTDTTLGMSKGAAGELALIHSSVTQFGVGAAFVRSQNEYRVGSSPGTKVLGARVTGWAPDTGTAKRTANATYSGTASATYSQAEMTAVMNALRDATQTIMALKADMIAHGLIGT